MGSTQELLARIRALEIENMELKSKLDQFQSIFTPGGAGPTPGSAAPNERVRRTNRGVGISAEPQNLKNITELTSQSFPEFKKNDR